MPTKYKCKKCGKFVSKNTLVCKHCGQENPAIQIEYNVPSIENTNIPIEGQQEFTKNPIEKGFQWKKTLLIAFVSIFVGLGMAKCISSIDDGSIMQGEECVFVKDEVGCVSDEAQDKMMKIATNNDKYGITEMLYSGEANGIAEGTHCKFLRDLGNGFCWVSVDSKFKSFIVPTSSIKRVNEK